MPELPEVEVVANQLHQSLVTRKGLALVVTHIVVRDRRLRKPVQGVEQLKNLKIIRVYRRAKYIIFETDKGYLLSHLGMTGSWKFQSPQDEFLKHDHLVLVLNNNSKLVYNDPRRFGLFEFAEDLDQFEALKKLGPEPLSDSFQIVPFYQQVKLRTQPIKVALMDAKLVVGVGNIYASEILFRAGVRPTKPSNKVSKAQLQKILAETRFVLKSAIQNGGSTLRDYRSLNGNKGGFQSLHQVYGRKNQACLKCETLIKARVLAGRSTFWCPKCQS